MVCQNIYKLIYYFSLAMKRNINYSFRNSPSKVYKIVLLGDGEVGKTCLLHRYKTGQFLDKTMPTVGIDTSRVNGQIRPLTSDAPGITRIDDGNVSLIVWDLAGQDRFHQIRKGYLVGAHGILFCVDLNNRSSFYDKKLTYDLKKYLQLKGVNPDYFKGVMPFFVFELTQALGKTSTEIPILVVGTKSDLERRVSDEEMNKGIEELIDSDLNIITYSDDNGVLEVYGDHTDLRSGRWRRKRANLYIPTSAKTGEGVNDAFQILTTAIVESDELKKEEERILRQAIRIIERRKGVY